MVVLASFTEDLSRWILCAVCWVSSGIAIQMARQMGRDFRPHLAHIAVWSFVFGAGIAELAAPTAVPLPTSFLIEWINAAAVSTIGGWVFLVWRLRPRRVQIQ